MKAIVKTSQEAGVFEVKEVPTPKPGGVKSWSR